MTNEDLKRFKESLSITAVARALGLNVVHGKMKCLHPQMHAHGDRTPSVSVSEERGIFRCWVCDDVRGDVFSLVQKVRGDCSFVEALDWLQNQFPFLAPQNVAPLQFPVHKRPESYEAIVKEETPKIVSSIEHKQIIFSFLKMLDPVDNTPAAHYLAKRRIHKKVWDKMLLRTIKDYASLNENLKEKYSLEVLKAVGLFNEKGNLRYYKHPLIFPYLDEKKRAFYFQSRAIDSTVEPKELNLRGQVPYPYNKQALNGKPGWIYLCEGVIDTLTFLNQGIDAVGIPGVSSFKMEWLPYFENKNIVLCLDRDAAGEKATEYLQDIFTRAGHRVTILGKGFENLNQAMQEGEDINDWFRKSLKKP